MSSLRLAIGLALAAVAVSASAQGSARKPYIVQLADAPLLTYSGGVKGLKATKPAAGSRLNVNASHVQAYSAYLAQKQAAVASTVPQAKVTYRYKALVNGFAAFLTDAELAKLVANPGVRAITEDALLKVDTSTTPTFLGINQPGNGVWNRTDANGRAIKGEGVIIGHLDGGIWPENPSFSDKVDALGNPIASHLPGTTVYDPLPAGRWGGICQPGMGFTAAHCNNKLIGARFFNSTWKLAESLGFTRTWSGDYLDSPRDADGHGTHTLSTSGGNENVLATVSGSQFRISGVAPRARVAAYKVCYVPADANDTPQQGSCYSSDSAAAADQAVLDGVDVINFSVGGSGTLFNDLLQTAFANATLNGVFISTSAGNSGPGNTVAHISPWTTTVGNSTHDRFTAANVTLGDGYVANGPSFQTGGLASTGLVYSRNAGFDGVPVSENQALCLGPADGLAALLDPAKVTGKILVCERGGNVLVNKTANGKTAGATGVIILNTPASANTTFNIAHVVPTVHLDNSHYAPLTGYMASQGTLATASFSASAQVPGVVAPVMADGSSRGPNRGDPNVLKPDITAPGTDIIAAYTNEDITPAQRTQIIAGTLVPGAGANMISGTSMAAPHVAGAAALLRQANPTWSPFAIKSALMTSAAQSVKLANGSDDVGGGSPLNTGPWGYGAGHLNPNVALDTKVVYDTSQTDLINYYFGAINGRQINLASLTHANVVGVGTLTRRLTNKGTTPVTYNATASLPGFIVTVSPQQLTIPPGGSASYTVTLRRDSVPLEQYRFGHVTWSGAGLATLRSPLTAKASMFVALNSVTDTRNVGTKVFTIGFGYDGSLFTSGVGLYPASRFDGRVADGQRQCFPFTVAAGTRMVRAQLRNSDVEGGSATDLDLVVLRGAATAGSSGAGDSNELVSLNNPPAGSYSACVDGFAAVGGAADYKLWVYVAGPANPGTLKAFGPSTVKTASVASIGISWNVPAGNRYLGFVDFRNSAGGTPMGSTVVFIDADAPGGGTPTYAPVLRDKQL